MRHQRHGPYLPASGYPYIGIPRARHDSESGARRHHGTKTGQQASRNMRLAIGSAALLVGAAAGQVLLDSLQLHHMNASMGTVWDAENRKVIAWWVIVSIPNVVLAVGILARVRAAALVAGSWAALLGLLWLWWSVMFIAKTGRLENPELYLYLVPPAFVLAYAIVLIGCIGIIRTQAPREPPGADHA